MLAKDAANKLQSAFATIDFFSRPSSGVPEFLVVRSEAMTIKIKMYEENGPHKTPHVHIDYGKKKHVASYAIKTGKRIVGGLDRKYDDAVTEWILTYKVDLQEAWDLTAAGKKPEHIIAKLKGTFD